MKIWIYLTALCLFFVSCKENNSIDTSQLVLPTVDENASLPSIFVNNTQLHSETFGDPTKPILLIIHGGPGADYRSLLNCKAFADDGYFVVFYDQRGSGLSKRHDADIYTTQIFIDDLHAVINHYQQDSSQRVILLGHSWGAMLATAYINDYPDRIAGLIMAEPGGFTWEQTKEYISRAFDIKLFSETTNDQVYLDQFLTGDDHELLDYKLSLSLAADFSEGNTVGNAGPYPEWRFGAICNSASLDYVDKHPFDFTTNLSQYTTKVLFTYSELSEAYGKEHAKAVASAYPQADLVKINGTGHEIIYFGWNQFYPVAKTYLESIK